MKKTLVALAVAAVAATSANAAVVYNQDGSKVEVGGSLRLLMTQYKGERTDLKNKGSRVIFKGTQDLGDGFSALGNVELRFEDDGKDKFGKVQTKRLYAGFAKEGIGQLTFGRQLTNLDDSGLSDYTYNLGGVNQTQTDGDKVARFRSASFAGLELGLDYFFGDKDKANDGNKSGYGASLFYTLNIAENTTLKFNAGYSQVKLKADKVTIGKAEKVKVSGTDENGQSVQVTVLNDKKVPYKEHKQKAFIVGTELASGPFAIAVDYSQVKATNNVNVVAYHSDSDSTIRPELYNRIRTLEVGVKYAYSDKGKVYGEYIWGKGNTHNDSEICDLDQFILGVDYKLHENVVTYVEGGTAKIKKEHNGREYSSERDNKIGVGFRVYF
ncbi:porin [Gallibacterium anatis]|uniref:porin n=1 Tax=Gallibacterium anatis TaxID=750 RepID=UPI0039FC1667